AIEEQGIGVTVTGTPKVTLTPTPTPTRPPSEQVALDVAVYRSLDDRLYILIPAAAGRRMRLTTLAIATGEVTAAAEKFVPGAPIADLVLTAFAGADKDDTLLPPSMVDSALVEGLAAHPDVASPAFDACAIDGTGLLTISGGVQVAALGRGPYA